MSFTFKFIFILIWIFFVVTGSLYMMDTFETWGGLVIIPNITGSSLLGHVLTKEN